MKKAPTPVHDAVVQCEYPGFTSYAWGKYRLTTYPGSDLIQIVLAHKTSKRVTGRHIEAAARAAITKAQTQKGKLES